MKCLFLIPLLRSYGMLLFPSFLHPGVPIAAPVAGVAVGLVTQTNPDDPYAITDYKLLTDILVRRAKIYSKV